MESINKFTLLYFILLAVFNTLYASQARAAERSTPFYFLTTDSQVKLLSQKLEYHILDKDLLQVGNLQISSKNMNITFDEKEGIQLVGPLQFMIGGILIIKDPLGKALWNKSIESPTQLTLSQANESSNSKILSNQQIRNDSGKYSFGSIEKLKEIVKETSFFNFCIFIETPSNRIQTCTEKYTLQKLSDKDSWKLTKMPEIDSKNVVLVNGTEVNEHGIIQFEKNINSISLAIRLASSLQVEIKTQAVQLSLLDIYYDKNSTYFTLKLNDKSNLNPETNSWYSKIPLNDPYLYIEAFGQAPFRQELSIEKDAIPSLDDKPLLIDSITKTYSDELNLELINKNQIKYKILNKGDRLKKTKSASIWTLRNLIKNEKNEHLLKLDSNNKSFMLGVSIEKEPSWVFALDLGTGNQSTISSEQKSHPNDAIQMFQFSLDKYFESFFGYTNSLNHLRWGFHTRFNQSTFKKSEITNDLSNMDLSYRFNENFHHRNDSTSLRLSYLTSSAKSKQTNIKQKMTWAGLKIHHDGRNKFLKSLLGDFHDIGISYYPSCLTEECKNIVLLNIEWQNRYSINNNSFWSWTLGYQNSRNSSSAIKETTTTTFINLGIGFEY